MPENHPDQPAHGLWVPVFEDFVDMAPSQMSPAEFMAKASMKLFDFVDRGLATDLGEIQEHFHTTNYKVQATAVLRLAGIKLLYEDAWPADRLVVRHPKTAEPKTHGLMLTVGQDSSELGVYLARQRSNHERNVRNLRDNTGMFELLPKA